MRIAVIGRRDVTGAGVFYGAFSDQLKVIGLVSQLILEVDVLDAAAMNDVRETSTLDDINIWFCANPLLAEFSGTNVLWAVFETTLLPRTYLEQIEVAQLIWTPSSWGRSVLIANGVDDQQIDIVPEGVNPGIFHPHFRQLDRNGNKPFHFLAVGKFEPRKSYEELLTAFSLAFAGQAERRLIVKADYFARADNRTAELLALVARFPELAGQVRILSGRLTVGEMAGVYGLADAFVFPSKGEGWGLPLIEALAAGLPTITTNYSGHSYYVEGCRSDVCIIDHTPNDINDDDFKAIWHIEGDPGQWVEPSIDSMAAHMRAVCEDYAHHQSRAFRASSYVRRNFSWSNSAHSALSCLRDRGLLQSVIQIDIVF